LLHSLAPQLKGWFGGESGIPAMRMPAWGLTYGSTTEVYYLTLAWVLVSLGGLYLYSRTPMGRLTLALRENGHRLRFLGYNVHGIAVSVFALSAMLSGIAGGLLAVSNESVNYVVFDAGTSATVVLNSYIGGVGSFLGPALGAALMTFFGYAVSDVTRSWLLYQGALFVLVMMFAPHGLAGLLDAATRLVRRHGAAAIVPMVVFSAGALLVAAGGVFIVEMVQRLFSQDYQSLARMNADVPIELFGRAWSPAALSTWLVPAALLSSGGAIALAGRNRLQSLRESTASDKEELPDGAVARQERERAAS
jgi:branched-chain amino acid transport system permease protein